MTEQTRKTVIAQIIENRTGVVDYDGFLSNLGEYHAAEFGFKYGLVSGLMLEAPDVAKGAAGLAGVSTIRKAADTGLPKYAQKRVVYVVLFYVIGFAVGAGSGKLPILQ